ncbi:MAG: PfkB family carbohydrate kinase, partial [Pseudomonadota bacterium]
DVYLEMGPTVVALTLGGDGVLVATPERRERLPAHRVEAVDATGAGDAFDGAFLARLAAGDDPFAAARHANAAAALAVQGYGAVAPLPTLAETQAFLDARRG